MRERHSLRNTTGELANEELERVAGGTHPLEYIPGVGQYVTAFLAVKDAIEDTVQDIKKYLGFR